MASTSAPANELAKQLPASASSLAVPPPAASTAEAVDLSAGAAIRGLLLLMLLLLRRVQASSPAKKLNAGLSCIHFSFCCRIRLQSTCSCLFAFWSCVEGELCFYVLVFIDGLRLCFIVVPCIWVCGLLCFVQWDGREHRYDYTTASSDPGSPNNVCLVADAWYNCSTRSDMRSEFGVSPRERPSSKKRQLSYQFGPAGTTRGSRE